MPEMTVHYTPPIGPEGQKAQAAIVSPLERARFDLYRTTWDDLAERGWNPATLINLHPFTLYGNGVLLRELRIPGVARDPEQWKKVKKLKLRSGIEVPYVKYVFRDPAVTVLEQVQGPENASVGQNSAKVTLPKAFVEDIFQQNNNPEPRGGVWGYLGDHDPLSDPKSDEYDKEFSRFETAHAQQIMFYQMLVDRADRAYAENNKYKMSEITDYNRWAARYLRNMGLLSADPKWLNVQIKVGPAVTQHCVCGAEVSSQAVICKECNHVLLPFRAFDEHVIDLESNGARLVLRRMSVEEIARLVEAERFTVAELEAVGFESKGKSKKKEKPQPVGA